MSERKHKGGVYINNPKLHEVKESIFNAGLAKLERIHKIKISMIQAATMNDFGVVVQLMKRYRMELHERMNAEQKSRCNFLQNRAGAALTNYQKKGATKELLESTLQEYEQYLNELEFAFGMSLPNKPDEFGGVMA